MSIENETGRYKAFVIANPIVSSFVHLVLGGALVYVAGLIGIL